MRLSKQVIVALFISLLLLSFIINLEASLPFIKNPPVVVESWTPPLYLNGYPFRLNRNIEFELLEAAKYDKLAYFQLLRDRLETKVTGKRGGIHDLCLEAADNRGHSLIHPQDAFDSGIKYIVVIGDSIARETANSLRGWTRGGLEQTNSCHHQTPRDLLREEWNNLDQWATNKTAISLAIGRQDCCSASVHANRAPNILFAWDPNISSESLVDALTNVKQACPCDGVIWMGQGLWSLQRDKDYRSHQTSNIRGTQTGYYWSTNAPEDRQKQVAEMLKKAISVSQHHNTHKTTILWQGSGSIDDGVIGAKPPRRNYDNFHPFVFTKHWQMLESVVVENIQATTPVRILHAPIAKVHDYFPGIRCDGIHYLSEFKEWDCTATPEVVDLYVQTALSDLIRS